jgi:hypothetical protein
VRALTFYRGRAPLHRTGERRHHEGGFRVELTNWLKFFGSYYGRAVSKDSAHRGESSTVRSKQVRYRA